MQFPAELTKGACVTSRPAELRLICIYFFTAHLFQVSSEWPRRLLYHRLAGGVDQLSSLCSIGALPLWAPLTPPALGRDKSDLRKEGFVLVHSCRVQSIMVGVLQERAGLARCSTLGDVRSCQTDNTYEPSQGGRVVICK